MTRATRIAAWTGLLSPACSCRREAREEGGVVLCLTCSTPYREASTATGACACAKSTRASWLGLAWCSACTLPIRGAS